MRIVYERSGGIANIRRGCTIDLAELPAASADAWRKLVADADFFNQPATFPAPPGADRFQNRITVEEDGKEHTVRVAEGAAPPGLAALIARLNEAAGPTRPH